MDKWAEDTKAGKLAPVGTTPYVAGLASYKPMEKYQSGRSRLDPTRIAEKMARGNARPGEIAAAQMMQRQQAIDAEMPITQARADEARFTSSVLADPEYQDVLRKKMMTMLSPEEEQKKDQVVPLGGQPAPAPSPAPAKATTMAPMTAQERGAVSGTLKTKNPAIVGATRAEGGEMEMEMDDEGGEDAYLLGEEGPEMVIKRDDGSMFVLPADVTKKIMSGIEMEDTEDNQDAMAAAMQRMGMEPKMGGGKMKPYMRGGKMGSCMCGGRMGSCMCGGKMKSRMGGGTMMKPYMGGGTMMAQETGRMAPKSRTIGDRGAGSRTIGDRGAGSRTQTRKNSLFDAMKKLI